MKMKIRTFPMVLIVGAAVVLVHSCFRQKSDKKDELPKIDRAQLCRDGGAAVNESTNECICTTGMIWNGVRCEAVPVPPESELASGDTPVEKIPSKPVVIEKIPQSPAPTEKNGKTAAPDWLPELKRACRIGNGSFLKSNQYCHCPNGKVLMGRRCFPMNGRMLDDVCLRAVKKGTWTNGVCKCPAGQTFSPGLGGCVDAPVTDKTILRRICSNSMNDGRWNEKSSTCTCPVGKVLIDETCVSKSKLTSATVCTSQSNAGTWDPARKVCNCPNSKIWVNQSCLESGDVEAESACLSELNRGKWNKKKGQCECPGRKSWIAAKKMCLPR